MAELIINDDNWLKYLDPTDARCGTLPRDYKKVPYGSIPGVPSSSIELIPMEAFPDLIADKARSKSTLKDIWADSPIGILDQGSSNYCHAFSLVWLAMLECARQGRDYIELSASSVGGPVTGWTNSGAYIMDDLMQSVRGGIASTDFVPMLTTNLSDCKPGWKEDAEKNKVFEYADLRPRNNHEVASCLLTNMPVGVGLNWCSHAVSYAVLRDMHPSRKADDWNRYGFEAANSWSVNWGDRGWAVLTGFHMTPDTAYTIRQVLV